LPFVLDCMDAYPLGHKGGTTPRMGEVESRLERRPRAPTVGALGDAGAVAESLPADLIRASLAASPVYAATINVDGVNCTLANAIAKKPYQCTRNKVRVMPCNLPVSCRWPPNVAENCGCFARMSCALCWQIQTAWRKPVFRLRWSGTALIISVRYSACPMC